MGIASERCNEFRFAIVEFCNDGQTQDGLLPIDLVPGIWIEKNGEQYFCKYPEKKDFEYVEKWTKGEREPDVRWKSYPVTIIHSAGDFAQGSRRLKRAFESRDCASTDYEGARNLEAPTMMSEANINEMLHTQIPMKAASKDREKPTIRRKVYDTSSDSNASDTLFLSSNRKQSKKSEKSRSQDHNFGENASPKSKKRTSAMVPNSKSILKIDDSSDSNASDDEFSSKKKIHGNKCGDRIVNRRTYITNAQIATDSDNSDNSKKKQTNAFIEKKTIRNREDAGTVRQVGRGRYPLQNQDCSENNKNAEKAHSLDDSWVEFMNHKFRELELSVHRKINSAKESLAYNFEHKMDELKLAVVASNVPRVPNGSLQELIAAVKTPLPISNVDEFIKFDAAINEDQEKKDAFLVLLHFLCFEFPTSQKCIENVLPKIFKKEVQGKYSGKGKKSKGVGKLNFSATATFTCFQEAIKAKFGESKESNGLASKVGIWLAHFGDREGGRHERGNAQG